MKKPFLSSLLAPLLFASAPLVAQVQTPFVETTTLTFFWGFSQTYISTGSTNAPALPDEGTTDPDTLPSGNRVFTDTGRIQAYTGPSSGSFAPAGANSQIIGFLVQKLIREGKLVRDEASYNWQLTAVREAPKNVTELAQNPYRLFLTAIERTSGGSISRYVPQYGDEPITDDPQTARNVGITNYYTGLTITLGEHSGTYTESLFSDTGKVQNARGSVTTAFTVQLGARYYEDPKHPLDDPKGAPGDFNYHLRRNLWTAFASGLITYNISSVPPPLPTFVASSVNATGTGYFTHTRSEVEYRDGALRLKPRPASYSYSGIAPLRLNMSNVQYQKRNLFPGLFPPAGPFSIIGILDTSDPDGPRINLTWTDRSFYETGYELERSINDPDNWTVIATLPADTRTYTDTSIAQGFNYYYRIRAFNDYGASAYSTVRQVDFPAPPPPPPPPPPEPDPEP